MESMMPTRKGPATRRSWTLKEEEVLVHALKDLVTRGYKADNGFKTGYLGMLEQAMLQAFPGTDLKSDPHINSKISVWKRNYNSLQLMLSKSGFAWNHSSSTIEVKNEAEWEAIVKIDSNAKSLRYKAFPFYGDWIEIFGKDRATGEHAEGCGDVAQEIAAEKKRNVASKVYSFGNTNGVGSNANGNAYADATSETVGDNPNNDQGKKPKAERKRKRAEVTASLVEVMNRLVTTTELHLADLAKRIGTEPVSDEDQAAVFAELGKISGLAPEDRIHIAKSLTNNKKELKFFFGLSDENKVLYVGMMLNGRI